MPAIASLTPKKAKAAGDSTPSPSSRPAFDVESQARTTEMSQPIVESFEIEYADDGAESRGKRRRCNIFPLDTLGWCCPTYLTCIPGPFRVLQGWTHLILLVGVYSTMFLLVFNLIMVVQDIADHKSQRMFKLDFAEEVVSVLLVAPSLWYFVGAIRQYDQDLSEKKREVQEKRQELVDDFQAMLVNLDDFLGETLRKTLDTAELGFELKQREFARFLEELIREWGEGMNAPEMLGQLRRFCANWAVVFAECSIDPLGKPRLIANAAQLQGCSTLGAVFNLIRDGCEEAQTEFIMSKKKKDEELCKANRSMFEKLTSKGNLACKLSGSVRPPGCTALSWITCGCTKRSEIKEAFGSDGFFPKVIPWGCGHIILLSSSHLWLIISLFAFVGLFVVELKLTTRAPMVAVCLIVEACILAVLFRFEDIDLVCQLQNEISDLRREKEQVLTHNAKMQDDWSKAQVCTDLWIYRTLPRLTLYSEVHGYFENTSMVKFEESLAMVNNVLERLEKRLPVLREWRNDGDVELEAKNSFRQAITDVSRQRKLEDIVSRLTEHRFPWED